MSNIVPFHARMRAIAEQEKAQAITVYELHWERGRNTCSISCTNRDQILRQMNSFARQKIAATVYANGAPAGFVGPGPYSRGGGSYQAFLIVDRK